MFQHAELNFVKKWGLFFGLAYLTTFSHASLTIDCNRHQFKKICKPQLEEQKQQLENKGFIAYLISDAPTQLLLDTHQIWLNRLRQCQNFTCYQQQFDQRIEDLNYFISINQSMTQHYLKVENGQISKQPIYLKVHQLNKDNIKIEAIAYKNPNNQIKYQNKYFLGYTTSSDKISVLNNEDDCNYDFFYTKSYLKISSSFANCSDFVGLYRLYD